MNSHLPHARGLNGAVVRQIKAERAANGMTVKQLATASGIPERTLTRYLNFERALQLGDVEALAAALGLAGEALVVRAQSERADD